MTRIWCSVALLLAIVTLSTLADTGSDDIEQNRRLLKKYQSEDPDLYAKLRRNLKAFMALPEERQNRLRQLDRDLNDVDSTTHVRLYRVLEKYTEWLQQLPETERRKIESEPDSKKRLQLIREIREWEWVEHLPKAVKDEVRSLPADKQRDRIVELRAQERKRREEWRVAILNWDALIQKTPLPPPGRVLTPELISFVNEMLKPMLKEEDRIRLHQGEGKWPLYPQTLVELADKYPIKLPGPTTGPTKFSDLPADVQKTVARLQDSPTPPVRKAEGKWPEYAQAVTFFARNNKLRLPRQLGPCRPSEFSSAVQQFLKEKLVPALDKDEKDKLTKAEGYWPAYPRIMLELSREHSLHVPGMTLPGPREMWNRFRASATTSIAAAEPLPDLPDEKLREFVRNDMTPEERTNLPSLSLNDSVSKAMAKESFYKKYPYELQRRRQADTKARKK